MRPHRRRGTLATAVCTPVLVWVTAASCDLFGEAEEGVGELWQESFDLSQELQAATTHLWQKCAEANELSEDQFPPTGPFHIAPHDEISQAMDLARPRVDADTAAEFGYQVTYPDYLHSDAAYDLDVLGVLYGTSYAQDVDGQSPPGTESISYVEWDETRSYHTEGCVGETYQAVYKGSQGEHIDKLLAATVPIEVDLQTDEEFLDTQEQWAECMNEAEYSRINGYQDTFATAMSFNQGDDDEFAAERIALAETDAACADEHDVNSTNFDSFIAALEETGDNNHEALSTYISHLRELVDHANELVENDEYPS